MDDLKTKDDYVKRYDRVARWSDEDKAYLVLFPELPGCVSDGRTLAEALKNSEDAAHAYLSALDDLGRPYPLPAAYSKETKQFALRLDMPLYQLLKIFADEMGVSVNETIVKRLSDPNFLSYSKSSPDIEAREKLLKAIYGKKPKRKKKQSSTMIGHEKRAQPSSRKRAQ